MPLAVEAVSTISEYRSVPVWRRVSSVKCQASIVPTGGASVRESVPQSTNRPMDGRENKKSEPRTRKYESRAGCLERTERLAAMGYTYVGFWLLLAARLS